ncbi:MAG TPA: single-stranded DNA-binding protein [Terriglobales bacterium]|nr:single-stranded DNA-binding protein [Terriglobales bacterium]
MRDTNSLNKVILIGRLGKKPEMRAVAQTGRQVARFTMATNERFFNKTTRETKDRTEWHNIVVWGNQAEFVEKYLDKGRQVVVEGKLRTRSWQDKDGNKRTTTEIEAENIVLLGRREGAGGGAEAPDYEPRAPREAEPEPEGPPFDEGSGGTGGGEDDVPF